MGAGLMFVQLSAAAITTLCVVVLLLPALEPCRSDTSVQHATQKFLPEVIAENSLTAVKPIPYSLTPWAGLGHAHAVRSRGGRCRDLAARPAGRLTPAMACHPQ